MIDDENEVIPVYIGDVICGHRVTGYRYHCVCLDGVINCANCNVETDMAVMYKDLNNIYCYDCVFDKKIVKAAKAASTLKDYTYIMPVTTAPPIEDDET